MSRQSFEVSTSNNVTQFNLIVNYFNKQLTIQRFITYS